MKKRQILLVSIEDDSEDMYWVEIISKKILKKIKKSNKNSFVMLGSFEIQTMKLTESLTLSKKITNFRIHFDLEFNKTNSKFDVNEMINKINDEKDKNLLIVMNKEFAQKLSKFLRNNYSIINDYKLSSIAYKRPMPVLRVA